MSHEYTCCACGESYISDVSDDEAVAQFEREFGIPYVQAETGVVCDDCYKELGFGVEQ